VCFSYATEVVLSVGGVTVTTSHGYGEPSETVLVYVLSRSDASVESWATDQVIDPEAAVPDLPAEPQWVTPGVLVSDTVWIDPIGATPTDIPVTVELTSHVWRTPVLFDGMSLVAPTDWSTAELGYAPLTLKVGTSPVVGLLRVFVEPWWCYTWDTEVNITVGDQSHTAILDRGVPSETVCALPPRFDSELGIRSVAGLEEASGEALDWMMANPTPANSIERGVNTSEHLVGGWRIADAILLAGWPTLPEWVPMEATVVSELWRATPTDVSAVDPCAGIDWATDGTLVNVTEPLPVTVDGVAEAGGYDTAVEEPTCFSYGVIWTLTTPMGIFEVHDAPGTVSETLFMEPVPVIATGGTLANQPLTDTPWWILATAAGLLLGSMAIRRNTVHTKH
jgi:hypothetical protein